MDYRKFATADNADRGATLTLKDFATGEAITAPDGKPMTIQVLGRDSKVYRDILHQRQKLTLQTLKGDASIDMADLEKQSTDLLAACTVAWSWMGDPASFDAAVDTKGKLDPKKIKALECTRENAAMIYSRFLDWREQVDAFVHERANFTPA
ncbi:MAG: hypothetical protein ACPG4X_19875 [Pikeienuella sp.]